MENCDFKSFPKYSSQEKLYSPLLAAILPVGHIPGKRLALRMCKRTVYESLVEMTMSNYNFYLRLLRIAGIFLLFGATMDAHAQQDLGCTTTQNFTFPIRNLVIPANAKVGDVLADSTLNFSISSRCMNGNVIAAWASPGGGGGVCHTPCKLNSNRSIGFTMTLDIQDSPYHTSNTGPGGTSIVNDTYAYVPGPNRPLAATARFQFVVLSVPVSTNAITGLNRFYALGETHTGFNTAVFSVGPANVITPTCTIPSQTSVTLDSANIRSFSGVGTASSVPAKSFVIPLQCTGDSGARLTGLQFSSAYRDASNAPGVIKVDQGAGLAAGIGLKIVNGTTRSPIGFDTLERGRGRLNNTGTNNFPFSVQYFQTGATITPGRVVGRVEISIAYE